MPQLAMSSTIATRDLDLEALDLEVLDLEVLDQDMAAVLRVLIILVQFLRSDLVTKTLSTLENRHPCG